MPAVKGAKKDLVKTVVQHSQVLHHNSVYSPACIPKVKQMAQSGMTDWEISRALGISNGTFFHWKMIYPELMEASIEGKEAVDKRVERCLYEKAIGYRWVEKQQVVIIDPITGEDVIREIEVEKHMPPDNTAMIFWLKNRRSDLWRDRIEHDVSGKLAISHEQAIKDLAD